MQEASNTTPKPWPYAVPKKALQKWVKHCLTLVEQPDGSIVAGFIYTGSTCSNLGHPLRALMTVKLSTKDESGQRRITSTGCTPSGNDLGVTRMCACLESPDRFLEKLNAYCPLEDMDLESAIRWAPSLEMAGCLCSEPSRNHKWRNVIQAIHFALHPQ